MTLSGEIYVIFVVWFLENLFFLETQFWDMVQTLAALFGRVFLLMELDFEGIQNLLVQFLKATLDSYPLKMRTIFKKSTSMGVFLNVK